MTTNEPGFGGRIGRTIADSTPWWPEPPRPPKAAPNVVLVMLDDTGFAHFGCYGSSIATPNIDRLAAGGLQYTGFHTTALCSPSRACLMTGRNHHVVGMRAVSNFDTGFPNMRGAMTPRAATLPELLRPHGYATYAAGKWHMAPMHECSAAGPHTNWPLQKGFDRFYGFLQGEADQFAPELTQDNTHVDPPGRYEDGYHVSEDIVDQSMGWIRDLKSVRPDRPFFLYVAFGATHAPHQAPREYVEKCRGKFDAGWDEVRQEWFERQIQLGVVPPGTTLAPRNPGVPAWESLTPNQKTFAARLQEAFAGFLEHTDAQIGRLVEFLESTGELDNTVFMVMSDNGASQEGGVYGVMDEFSFFNLVREDIDDIVANRLDDIGGPRAHNNYPWGWAQVGNTPLKWYKQNTYGGGVRDPLIIHYPAAIQDPGQKRDQFCHITDVVPTVLDILGIDLPEQVNGHQQIPLSGESLAYTWQANPPATIRRPQYFEQFGHRGLWMQGWKAVTYHLKGKPFEEDNWSLYHLDADFSECHDLGPEHPEKLRELVDAWWVEAGANGVLPLDDRTQELFGMAPRPGTPHARDRYEYFPPISHIPSDAAPPLGARNWTATFELSAGRGTPEGVLYARGNHNVGHSFFLKDGLLQFDYNALGKHSRAAFPCRLAAGDHVIEARFDRTSRSTGTITLSVDGGELGVADVPFIVRMLGSTGLDIGCDRLSTVVDDYAGPFPFEGIVRRATFQIRGERDKTDIAVIARTELAKE